MEDQMANEYETQNGKICGTVFDGNEGYTGMPIRNAHLTLYDTDPGGKKPSEPVCPVTHSNDQGYFEFAGLYPKKYWVQCDAFLYEPLCKDAIVDAGSTTQTNFAVPVGFQIATYAAQQDCAPLVPCNRVTAGKLVTLRGEFTSAARLKPTTMTWNKYPGLSVTDLPSNEAEFATAGHAGKLNLGATLTDAGGTGLAGNADLHVLPPVPQLVNGNMNVTLQRSPAVLTDDVGLWAAIRTHAKAISFGGLGVKGKGRALRGYQGFIERVLCGDGPEISSMRAKDDPCGPAPDLGHLAKRAKHIPMHGMAAYDLLKTATEIFLLWNCGVAVRDRDDFGNPITTDNEERARSGLGIADVTESLATYLGKGRLPYIERVVQTAFSDYVSLDHGHNNVFDRSVFCTGVLTPRADCVCLIELIWSYWQEEAMLVQTMNAISQRFQNVRSISDRDPLAHVTIDPLRTLNNLLWGYIQDEPNRLTVKRRGAEYDHEYGITLRGKAVIAMRPADSRSKFLEGFHNLLHKCSIFYKEDNDTTVIADGYPLLNALKEVHLLLAQGAHNQFGDLPWAARVEMLIQQWMLARPEMRDFLQSRPMVPYTEAWMPQVDTMKTLQGWSDVTVTHYNDLAAFGEQILLSVRYGDWIDLNDENHAKNWARYWRPEIQSYIHAYRTVTGIDLTNPDTVDYTMPAVHLQKRLALQRAR
jgi:hypothetical protein